MEIITHILKKFITNKLPIFSPEFIEATNSISRRLHTLSLRHETIDIHHFGEVIYGLVNTANIQNIKRSLEDLDLEYFNSNERKELFMSKRQYTRTLDFLFGEISITRYYYVDKVTGKNLFYYLDKVLGFDKYLRFTRPVQDKLLFLVAEHGSYAKAGKVLGEFIHKFSTIDDNFKHISRATVFNYVKRVELNYYFKAKHRRVDSVYIELDEHFIPIQSPKNSNIKVKKKMVKVVKIYSSKHSKYGYSDRFIIIDNLRDNFKSVLYDYVCSEYDLDFVRNVYIMGDGANWIKSCRDLFDRNKSVFLLDKFHAYQAVTRLVTSRNKDAYDFVCSFIANNDLKTFKIWYSFFLIENDHRKDVIECNFNYLCNQWVAIQRTIHSPAQCSMEGCISSSIADGFTSRPKGFSYNILSTRLMLRMFYRNAFGNEEKFYDFTRLHSYNRTSCELDFSIFDFAHKPDNYKLNSNIFKPSFYHYN